MQTLTSNTATWVVWANTQFAAVFLSFFFTGRPARSAAMLVLFLFSGPKIGFSRHAATINVKFGTVEQTESQISQPPKLSKFGILAINLCLRGDLFALFLRNSQLL